MPNKRNCRIPKRISLLVFDFDGVFTDNFVYVDEDGRESVRCSRADGLGISLLRKQGMNMCILSTEKNPVVAARGKKLELPVFQGCADKANFLKRYCEQENIPLSDVMYVGNDVNDTEAMELVGYSVCPADAHEQILKIAGLVLRNNGGCGAVRELCDYILHEESMPHNIF